MLWCTTWIVLFLLHLIVILIWIKLSILLLLRCSIILITTQMFYEWNDCFMAISNCCIMNPRYFWNWKQMDWDRVYKSKSTPIQTVIMYLDNYKLCFSGHIFMSRYSLMFVHSVIIRRKSPYKYYGRWINQSLLGLQHCK